MCSWRDALVSIGLGAAAMLAAAQGASYVGIGRAATSVELAAWDTDVRTDFKGLPKGSGTVAQGQQLWEDRCAGCHGMFGESNSVFQPIAGGTSEHDVKSGRSARLTDPSFPGRTTLMKLPTLSTLWDYVYRAMPWSAPKSLSPDQVYAVVAYMLNLGGVVPDDFVLSDATIERAQARLPNRNGMTTAHALWPGVTARADVAAVRCMRGCAEAPRIASTIPDHARDAHGNLAEQNRSVGAQRGVDTSRAPSAGVASPASTAAGAWALAGKHGCTACHGIEGPLVGPGFRDVGRKHAARGDAVTYLNDKIRSGGAGTWGNVPMPPQSLPEADALVLARWIAQGAVQ
jgi:S-disulfanyl-L-cysteine oxidoreductase SoxD